MVQGQRSAREVLKAMKAHAKLHSWSVKKLPKRGKGSHEIWVVLDDSDKEIGRIGLTGHAGKQSPTVTRSNEEALELIFGEGWLD